jgi:hypothetical protein
LVGETVGDVSSRDGRDGRYVIALGGCFRGDVEFFRDFCGRKSATTGDTATSLLASRNPPFPPVKCPSFQK